MDLPGWNVPGYGADEFSYDGAIGQEGFCESASRKILHVLQMDGWVLTHCYINHKFDSLTC
jgi:hypothetical protein